jgi:hypothetical protein
MHILDGKTGFCLPIFRNTVNVCAALNRAVFQMSVFGVIALKHSKLTFNLVLVDILGEECHDCFPSSLTT